MKWLIISYSRETGLELVGVNVMSLRWIGACQKWHVYKCFCCSRFCCSAPASKNGVCPRRQCFLLFSSASISTPVGRQPLRQRLWPLQVRRYKPTLVSSTSLVLQVCLTIRTRCNFFSCLPLVSIFCALSHCFSCLFFSWF